MIRGKNMVAFSKDWQNDWTSNHHVLTILARENKIFWINSIGIRTPDLRSGKDWRRIIKKIPAGLKGPKKVIKNRRGCLYVFTPLVWPFFKSSSLRRISLILLLVQLRLLIFSLKMKPFQLWTFIPTAEPFFGKMGEQLSVYYCTDEWLMFPRLGGVTPALMENKLLQKVDVVFAASNYLKTKKGEVNKNIHLSNHGTDKMFLDFTKGEPPEEINKIRRPIIGFYGWVRDSVDKEIIFTLAQSRPDYSIVLIGKVTGDFDKLKSLTNVYFLGQKTYAQLPSYAAHFDVALIPYRMAPELMAATNPVKLKEYFALGLPVVTTDLAEVYPYKEVCWIAKNDNDFIRFIDEALGPEGKRRGSLGKKMVSGETWEVKVDKISEVLTREKNYL